MQRAFKIASSPGAHNVLGLTLDRLTLGHVFLLAKAESPLVCDGEPAFSDLVTAVYICAQPWREADKSMRKWWYRWFCWAWGWRCRRLDIGKEVKKLLAYIDEEMALPLVKREVTAGQVTELSSPWYYRLLAVALADFGLGKQEAMDMPLAELNCLWAALGEYRGAFNLWSDRDELLWQNQVALDKQQDNQYGRELKNNRYY